MIARNTARDATSMGLRPNQSSQTPATRPPMPAIAPVNVRSVPTDGDRLSVVRANVVM